MEQFSNDGLTFDVIDSGSPNAAPAESNGATTQGTVVLLHGFPQTAQIWQDVTPILNASGLRTLAFDQRGYSPGARPRGRRNYRIEALVGDAVALIELLDEGPVHLVGHDWGAVVAWQLAATRPDLLASLTTLSVTHPKAMLKSMLTSPQLLRSWYMGMFQLPFAPEALATRAPAAFDKVLEFNGMTPAQIHAVHENVVDTGALSYGINWYRALPFADFASSKAKIVVPTAHVWGEGDVALDRRGAELAGEYVDAPFELHIIGGGGHWLPENHPERIAEIVLGLAG